jgi:bifunctional non-homologous end joining protein LigD
MPTDATIVGFVEPMLLLATSELPQGPQWSYEIKLDGYRAIAIKKNGDVRLRSRNDKDFNRKYPRVAEALASLPDNTVVDGEIVALNESGRPSFNALQNYEASNIRIFYYIFDVLILKGHSIMAQPLSVRQDLLRAHVLPDLSDPIRECQQLDASLPQVIAAVRGQGLEGVVAKNLESIYEPGRRSGAWQKMRINKGQEFVIGGFTTGAQMFDALIFGYYEGDSLIYTGRTRNGFTPLLREQLQQRLRDLETPECPFRNLPETKSGRWGLGLTAEKMKQCKWVAPVLVAQFEYTEWTPDNHLRHSRFVALREDVDPKNVRRE